MPPTCSSWECCKDSNIPLRLYAASDEANAAVAPALIVGVSMSVAHSGTYDAAVTSPVLKYECAVK